MTIVMHSPWQCPPAWIVLPLSAVVLPPCRQRARLPTGRGCKTSWWRRWLACRSWSSGVACSWTTWLPCAETSLTWMQASGCVPEVPALHINLHCRMESQGFAKLAARSEQPRFAVGRGAAGLGLWANCSEDAADARLGIYSCTFVQYC